LFRIIGSSPNQTICTLTFSWSICAPSRSSPYFSLRRLALRPTYDPGTHSVLFNFKEDLSFRDLSPLNIPNFFSHWFPLASVKFFILFRFLFPPDSFRKCNAPEIILDKGPATIGNLDLSNHYPVLFPLYCLPPPVDFFFFLQSFLSGSVVTWVWPPPSLLCSLIPPDAVYTEQPSFLPLNVPLFKNSINSLHPRNEDYIIRLMVYWNVLSGLLPQSSSVFSFPLSVHALYFDPPFDASTPPPPIISRPTFCATQLKPSIPREWAPTFPLLKILSYSNQFPCQFPHIFFFSRAAHHPLSFRGIFPSRPLNIHPPLCSFFPLLDADEIPRTPP